MNLLPRLFLPVVISIAASTLALADSTTVSTDPVGFTTGTANASGTAGVVSYTLASLDLTRPVDYQGAIPAGGASVSGSPTVLTFTASTFTGLTFTGTGNSHYIEITNGPGAGVMSTIVNSDNDHSLTLADDLSAIIDNAGGTTTFKTRPHWTIGTVFGSGTNPWNFQGATTAGGADTISTLDPVSGALTSFYYNTNNNKWQQAGKDATNTTISPETGILITRKGSTPVVYTLQGAVKTGTTCFYITGGTGSQSVATIIPNPYPLNSVTLASSGLYTGTNTTGVTGASTAGGADTVAILSPSGALTPTYYYNTKNNRWQQGGQDASTAVIGDGTAVLITRKSGQPSFNWYVPQPAIAP